MTKAKEPPAGLCEIKSGKNFQFLGLSQGKTDPTPTECGGFPYLYGRLIEQFNGYRFTLPSPQMVLPLRRFRVRCNPKAGSHLPRNPFAMAMCHVLVYDGVSSKDVKVICTDTNQPLWKNGEANHLHLFVEPATTSEGEYEHDSNAALDALQSSYGTERFGLESQELCPRLDNVSDFCDDLEEQFFIYEWSRVNVCAVTLSYRVEHTFKPQGCPQFWITQT